MMITNAGCWAFGLRFRFASRTTMLRAWQLHQFNLKLVHCFQHLTHTTATMLSSTISTRPHMKGAQPTKAVSARTQVVVRYLLSI